LIDKRKPAIVPYGSKTHHPLLVFAGVKAIDEIAMMPMVV
jgi:hypothetical protein